MAEYGWNGWEWLDKADNGWKWQDRGGNSGTLCNWLELTLYCKNHDNDNDVYDDNYNDDVDDSDDDDESNGMALWQFQLS